MSYHITKQTYYSSGVEGDKHEQTVVKDAAIDFVWQVITGNFGTKCMLNESNRSFDRHVQLSNLYSVIENTKAIPLHISK